MFGRRLIIVLIVSTVLIFGGGFAITHGFVTPREAGVFGALLLVIPTVVLTLLFKPTGLTPSERAAQAQRDFKKRKFGLYFGLIPLTFALIRVFDVTRAEPLYMKVVFRGLSIAGLGLIAACLGLTETRARWLWLQAMASNADSLGNEEVQTACPKRYKESLWRWGEKGSSDSGGV